jgi:hypothetical protein
LKIFCDSDLAGVPETRISVIGFIVCLLDLPICWRSKAQSRVKLSSAEAEYIAIFEAAKEIKFIYYLLKDLHAQVNFPIIVKTYNVGTIFMSKNGLTDV